MHGRTGHECPEYLPSAKTAGTVEQSDCMGLLTITTCLNLSSEQLCETRDGSPRLPVPDSSYGLCGHKATFEEVEEEEGGSACLARENEHKQE